MRTLPVGSRALGAGAATTLTWRLESSSLGLGLGSGLGLGLGLTWRLESSSSASSASALILALKWPYLGLGLGLGLGLVKRLLQPDVAARCRSYTAAPTLQPLRVRDLGDVTPATYYLLTTAHEISEMSRIRKILRPWLEL
eukprot:scaffold28015_cov43-Phaeocystis_antarctica.AAC.2